MASRVRPVAEFEGPLHVGRYYLVPCVRMLPPPDDLPRWAPAWLQDVWWPVIGPPHGDPDLGVGPEHFHFDLRFLTDRFITRWSGHDLPHTLARVQPCAGAGSTELRRRRCARPVLPEFPRVPGVGSDKRAFENLERRHARDVLCRVCPHRGMRAADMPIVDGVRVCHGHGLGWDVATGALVKRHGKEAPRA